MFQAITAFVEGNPYTMVAQFNEVTEIAERNVLHLPYVCISQMFAFAIYMFINNTCVQQTILLRQRQYGCDITPSLNHFLASIRFYL